MRYCLIMYIYKLKFMHLMFEAIESEEAFPTSDGRLTNGKGASSHQNDTKSDVFNSFTERNRTKIEGLKNELRHRAYALLKKEEAKIIAEMSQINFLQLQKVEAKTAALEDYEKLLFHENMIIRVTL